MSLESTCPFCNTPLIGLSEAAKELGISHQRVHVLVQEGKLDAWEVQIGGQRTWVIDPKAIERRKAQK